MAAGGAEGRGTTTADGVVAVRLRGVPTELFVRLNLHIDELLRELEIIEMGEAAGAADGAGELHQVAHALLDRYAHQRESAWQQAELAAGRRDQRLDLELVLPREAADAADELATLFERADDLSRQDRLLTVAAPADVASLRRWIAGEIGAQLRHGAAPAPCPL